ncbi:uncharacterized protein BYT42DRAFT_348883 [Radiomyces spectabilis]|uniref:uncharacterized protein n=1 Tax=Radiomyces spectabilis TaxID=64574 RepID=UPI002220B305|nr:uncharacterized protein BYT42DRAFT_348883 [Radiomyces spectabilis]KAI8377572.1 hypothetical protein BYT42DRAFT_348883 [Radiomyces spectabilis]
MSVDYRTKTARLSDAEEGEIDDDDNVLQDFAKGNQDEVPGERRSSVHTNGHSKGAEKRTVADSPRRTARDEHDAVSPPPAKRSRVTDNDDPFAEYERLARRHHRSRSRSRDGSQSRDSDRRRHRYDYTSRARSRDERDRRSESPYKAEDRYSRRRSSREDDYERERSRRSRYHSSRSRERERPSSRREYDRPSSRSRHRDESISRPSESTDTRRNIPAKEEKPLIPVLEAPKEPTPAIAKEPPVEETVPVDVEIKDEEEIKKDEDRLIEERRKRRQAILERYKKNKPAETPSASTPITEMPRIHDGNLEKGSGTPIAISLNKNDAGRNDTTVGNTAVSMEPHIMILRKIALQMMIDVYATA